MPHEKPDWREELGKLHEKLQQEGAVLKPLDTSQQKWPRKRNNNAGANSAPHDTSNSAGGSMSKQHETTERTTTVKEKEDSGPPPAGGIVTENLFDEFARSFRIANDLRAKEVNQTVGQRIINVAIPSVIVSGAVVGTFGALVLINNKWGTGKQPVNVTVKPTTPMR